jgi:lactate permease
LVVIGFCFGALLEGIAGFGAPVAITASLLIFCGFPALEAVVFVLIFNTTPVAFGALGTPVTVLGAVTGLPAPALAAMIGRQLPLMAAILPFYVMALYGGWRSIRALWPMLLVAGVSFGLAQFASSNYLDYTLTDVFAALGSLAVTLLFLQVWRPAPDPEFTIAQAPSDASAASSRPVPAWQGWMPWLIVTATVILWTYLKVTVIGQKKIPWPGLDQAVAITLYHDKPYAAVWTFQPLGTGTRFCWRRSSLPCWFNVARRVHSMRGRTVRDLAGRHHRHVDRRIGLCGTTRALPIRWGAVATTRHRFILFRPSWDGLPYLSGSDTSGNALFGNLQVVAARQL